MESGKYLASDKTPNDTLNNEMSETISISMSELEKAR